MAIFRSLEHRKLAISSSRLNEAGGEALDKRHDRALSKSNLTVLHPRMIDDVTIRNSSPPPRLSNLSAVLKFTRYFDFIVPRSAWRTSTCPWFIWWRRKKAGAECSRGGERSREGPNWHFTRVYPPDYAYWMSFSSWSRMSRTSGRWQRATRARGRQGSLSHVFSMASKGFGGWETEAPADSRSHRRVAPDTHCGDSFVAYLLEKDVRVTKRGSAPSSKAWYTQVATKRLARSVALFESHARQSAHVAACRTGTPFTHLRRTNGSTRPVPQVALIFR